MSKPPFTREALEAEIVRLAEAEGWEISTRKEDQIIDTGVGVINLSSLASELFVWIKEQKP